MHEMRNGLISKWNIRKWLHLNKMITVKLLLWWVAYHQTMRVTKLYHYLLFVSLYGSEIVFKSYFLIAQILRHESKIAIYPGNVNDVFIVWLLPGCCSKLQRSSTFMKFIIQFKRWKGTKDVLINVRCCLWVCTITLMERYENIFLSKHTANIYSIVFFLQDLCII